MAIRRVGLEPDAGHRPRYFHVTHEAIPDQTAAIILRHEQHDTGVYGQHIVCDPTGVRVERIGKTIFAPDAIALPMRFAKVGSYN